MKDQRNVIIVAGFLVEIAPDYMKNKELTVIV